MQGADPAAEFARELRALRQRSGSPTYREMAERVYFNHTTLSRAAGGRLIPNLSVTLAYVRASGGDPAAEAAWRRRWEAAFSSKKERPQPSRPIDMAIPTDRRNQKK